jgi:hypothetical protein
MGEGNGLIEHDLHGSLVPMNGSHSGSSGRSTPNNSNDPAPGKLFVGGLSWQTSSEKLREYFGMFGNVTDVLIMKDPVTQVRQVRVRLDEALTCFDFFAEESGLRFYHILGTL